MAKNPSIQAGIQNEIETFAHLLEESPAEFCKQAKQIERSLNET